MKLKIVQIISIILLIIVILLSFYMYKVIGKINDMIPTGNIDIFDIIIDCDCPVFGENDINISDDNGIHSTQENLRIFENPAYQMKNVISPGSSNMYQFVVRNGADFSIKYSIEMLEKNDNKINMKYRLKLNGNYVIGNKNKWVTAEELKMNYLNLLNNSNDVYSLEWKWFESENDTNAGITSSDYSLTINFKAEQIFQ